MATKVNEKDQIVIPANLRRKFGIKAGTKDLKASRARDLSEKNLSSKAFKTNLASGMTRYRLEEMIREI